MLTLTIDGKEVRAHDGSTILAAARNVPGVGKIPTLCYDDFQPDLRPARACRVCTVEIIEDGRSRFALACVTRARNGMVVSTNSEKVQQRRQEIVGKHLARCSKVKVIQDLARELGATPAEGKLEEEECILCGMCERACKDPRGLGAGAIRLIKQDDVSYYQVDEEECVSCGDCVVVCPLGSIELREKAILPKAKAMK